MLIDAGYFTKGDRQIQNSSANPGIQNSYAVKAAIEGFIEEYQPVYLRDAVGEELAEQISGLVDVESGESSSDIDTLIEMLREPFAEYVFFHMIRTNFEVATIDGIVRLSNTNSPVSPLRAMVAAWGRMVDGHERMVEWAKDTSGISVKIQKSMLEPLNSLNI